MKAIDIAYTSLAFGMAGMISNPVHKRLVQGLNSRFGSTDTVVNLTQQNTSKTELLGNFAALAIVGAVVSTVPWAMEKAAGRIGFFAGLGTMTFVACLVSANSAADLKRAKVDAEELKKLRHIVKSQQSLIHVLSKTDPYKLFVEALRLQGKVKNELDRANE